MANDPQLAMESIAGQRPYQEDAVLARGLADGRVLIAVADGMGGHAAGEVASAVALETLVAALEAGKELDVAITLANAKVFEQAREPDKKGMGTTLVAALVDDGEYMVANVGDSRGYLLSEEGIRQITDDHSFVAEAVKRGQSEAEAMATPWKDALTRSIGTGPDVEVDVFGPFPVVADTALVMCSDGLYKTLTDGDLERIFLQSGSVRGAAQSLVSSALESGSDDNISVVIAEYGEVPREMSQATVPIEYRPRAEDDMGSVTDDTDDSGDADDEVVASPGAGMAPAGSVERTPREPAPVESREAAGVGVPPAGADAGNRSLGESVQVPGASGGPSKVVVTVAVVVLAAVVAALVLGLG